MTHASRIVTLLIAVALIAGCDDGAGPGNALPPVDTNWNEGMTLDELQVIAEALGIELVEDTSSSKVTKDDVVDALEAKTGCGCFDAVCGTGACDHECGSCAAEQACFSGTCETEATCPMVTLAGGTQKADLVNDTESLKFRYEAVLPAGAPFDKVRVFYHATVADPLGPGTYDLRHHGTTDCKPCVTAYTGCLEGGACNSAYIARAGVVQIDEITPDGQFKGSLGDVKFEEAYEDPKTGIFTLLNPQNFKPKCTAKFDFDVKLESTIVEPQDCDPEGNGTGIGDRLADFTLTNCNGESVNLHGACGKKALWLVAAAGW